MGTCPHAAVCVYKKTPAHARAHTRTRAQVQGRLAARDGGAEAARGHRVQEAAAHGGRCRHHRAACSAHADLQFPVAHGACACACMGVQVGCACARACACAFQSASTSAFAFVGACKQAFAHCVQCFTPQVMRMHSLRLQSVLAPILAVSANGVRTVGGRRAPPLQPAVRQTQPPPIPMCPLCTLACPSWLTRSAECLHAAEAHAP